MKRFQTTGLGNKALENKSNTVKRKKALTEPMESGTKFTWLKRKYVRFDHRKLPNL